VLDEKVAAAKLSQNSMRPTDAGALRLMIKLRDAWIQHITSRELRKPTSDMVELICGLDKIYQAHGGQEISDTTSWQQQLSMAVSSSGHHKIGSPILENEEVLIEVEPGTLESYRVNTGLAFHRPKGGMIKIGGKECVATNRSNNGYCLSWPDSGDGGTHVGELVEISPKSINGDESEATLGVIRWMHSDQPGFLGMGVELLHGLFEPVVIQRKQEQKQWTETMKGFMQHTNGGEFVSLIVPPCYIAEEDQIRVVTDVDDIPIDITNIIESTDSFVRLKFEQASEVHLAS
jgi:hypothetical protein